MDVSSGGGTSCDHMLKVKLRKADQCIQLERLVYGFLEQSPNLLELNIMNKMIKVNLGKCI